MKHNRRVALKLLKPELGARSIGQFDQIDQNRYHSLMPRKVSLYEAKTNLSRLVRQVREGGSVVITVHGEPAAELRAVAKPRARAKVQTLAERLAELEARGEIIPATMRPGDPRAWKPGKAKPGALKRFLEERNRD